MPSLAEDTRLPSFTDEELAPVTAQLAVLTGQMLQTSMSEAYVDIDILAGSDNLGFVSPANQHLVLSGFFSRGMSTFSLDRKNSLQTDIFKYESVRHHPINGARTQQRERIALNEEGNLVKISETETGDGYVPHTQVEVDPDTILEMAKQLVDKADDKEGNVTEKEIPGLLYSSKDFIPYQSALVPILGQVVVIAGNSVAQPTSGLVINSSVHLDAYTHRLYGVRGFDGSPSNSVSIWARNSEPRREVEFALEATPLPSTIASTAKARLSIRDYSVRPIRVTTELVAQSGPELVKGRKVTEGKEIISSSVEHGVSLGTVVEMAGRVVTLAEQAGD